MTLSKTAFFAVLLMLGGIAAAGEEHQTRIDVMVADGHGSDGIHFKIDSDDPDFNLEDMQEGESRSIVDEDGRSILVTRTTDGFEFNVDGETVEMPLFSGAHDAMWIGEGDGVDVDVRVMGSMGGTNFTSADEFDGVTILSSKPIDGVTREGIKSLLGSSGHSGEVNFVDAESGPHGAHEIRVIKKEVVSEN